jgi:hypothetical protein
LILRSPIYDQTRIARSAGDENSGPRANS